MQKLATLHARASDPHRDGFAASIASAGCGQLAVGLKNEAKRFPQVAPSFGKRSPLRVDAGYFLYVGDVPPVPFLNDSREFSLHHFAPLKF
ncbi:MAG: hypothetical protein HY508_02515 [Acidobacteria bacterium]|nr:hypothetical protein [Acidobacteriota bacterium]